MDLWKFPVKDVLTYGGLTDLTAAFGETGLLLLDPTNITISTGSDSSITGNPDFVPNAGTSSVISESTLESALASANVTILTAAGGGSEKGDVTFDVFPAVTIDSTSGNNLTITADGDIKMFAGSIDLGSGALSLTAGNTRTDGVIVITAPITAGGISASADGTIQLTGNIDVNGGLISGTLTETSGSFTADSITSDAQISASTQNGSVSIESSGDVTLNSIIAGTASVTIETTNGAINDHSSDTISDITADTISLSATAGIGNIETIELESASNISITSSGTQNIDIDHAADAPTSVSSISQTGSGNINFDQTGSQSLTFSGTLSTGLWKPSSI